MEPVPGPVWQKYSRNTTPQWFGINSSDSENVLSKWWLLFEAYNYKSGYKTRIVGQNRASDARARIPNRRDGVTDYDRKSASTYLHLTSISLRILEHRLVIRLCCRFPTSEVRCGSLVYRDSKITVKREPGPPKTVGTNGPGMLNIVPYRSHKL